MRRPLFYGSREFFRWSRNKDGSKRKPFSETNKFHI